MDTKPKLPTPPDSDWQTHAIAFLARCRGQMWGRHKEDPLSWLYDTGFSVPFAQEQFFGWNFRPMRRNAAPWLGPAHEGEKILIPQGLILPWIREETFYRLSVLMPDGTTTSIPGSTMAPLFLGEGTNVIITFDDGDAFRLLQEANPTTCVMAAPRPDDLDPPCFSHAGRIRIVSPKTEEALGLLAALRAAGRMVEAVFLTDTTITRAVLSGRLTEQAIVEMARF